MNKRMNEKTKQIQFVRIDSNDLSMDFGEEIEEIKCNNYSSEEVNIKVKVNITIQTFWNYKITYDYINNFLLNKET